MKTPRCFLGAVVLFWGWQVQLLWLAMGLAILLESARLMKVKYALGALDFNKFVDVSLFLLAGIIVMALTIEAEKAHLIILKWIPLVFFPIIAAQEFSAKGKIDSLSFLFGARKRVKIQFYEPFEIDVSYIYSLFCLLSAGTANARGHLFYLCLALFFVRALWQVRSRRFSVIVWTLCILAGISFGFAGQKGLHLAAGKMNHWMMRNYARYYRADAIKTATALGEIGKLKFSDKIVLRVSSQDYIPGKTYLLHTATYNKFALSKWFVKSGFKPVAPDEYEILWQINPPVETTEQLTAYFRPVRKRAVLSLPPGVVSISEMKADACEKNAMQAIRIQGAPPLVKSVVFYTDTLSYDPAPHAHDLLIPRQERLEIEKIAEHLALADLSEEEILKAVKRFFLTQYTYSLDLKGKGTYETPLQNFLIHTKSGHCEFFATATALVLREAKIPARYATGYIAHEYSPMENQLVVRHRDAHAWVKVYVNGQWRNFDTTPASFLQVDSQEIKPSPVADFVSFLGFKLSQFRHETGIILMDQYGLWLMLPLGVILAFRLRKSNKIKKIKIPGNIQEEKDRERQKTSFYLIEQALSQKGMTRYPHETYGAWLDRIGHHFDSIDTPNHLHTLVQLHNRWRFSQSGLKEKEKTTLDAGVSSMLKKIAPLS